ncbi:MAG: sialidase family protein [Mycobacteriales bacterium]
MTVGRRRSQRREVAVLAAVLLAAGGTTLGPTTLLAAAGAAGRSVASPGGGHLIATPVTVGKDGNEPTIVEAPDGTLYISALQHLYVSRSDGRQWTEVAGSLYSNQLNLNSDSSIAVDPGGRLYFTFDYPYAGITAVCTSDDHAASFTCDPATVPGGTDRMWITAPSDTASYLSTNEGLTQELLFDSTDRGATYYPDGTATQSATASDDGEFSSKPHSTILGQVVVDNASNVTTTTEENSGPLALRVFNTANSPLVETLHDSPLLTSSGLPAGAYDATGTYWLASDVPDGNVNNPTGRRVLVARTGNDGVSWTVLPPVPGTSSGTATFTTIAVGAPGHIGVLYYQTAAGSNAGTVPVKSVWNTMWAETTDAYAAHPTWTVQDIDPHVHVGVICSAITCMGDGRFSGDFISATFGPAGNPHLAWVKEIGTSGVTEVRYATSVPGSASAPLGAPRAPAAGQPRAPSTKSAAEAPPRALPALAVTGGTPVIPTAATVGALGGILLARRRRRGRDPRGPRAPPASADS